MAIFSIEIPDEDVDRVVDAICANYHYHDQISNPDFDDSLDSGPDNLEFIDNPESRGGFANRVTREFLMNNTHSYELKLARKDAEAVVPTPPAIADPSDA